LTIIFAVASLLHGVTEHCLAGIQSHCLDKVDDIQAVRKFSTDQCNSSGQLWFFCGSMKKTSVFPLQETPTLTVSFFENGDLVYGTVALVKCHFLINWF